MSGDGRPSRRRFLTGAAGLVGGGLVAVASGVRWPAPAAAAAAQPAINSRDAWGSDLPPIGPLESELPGDTRFLLVHHTAGANGYPREAVRSSLRSIYAYHTGPKGWSDVAYNFLIDAYGGIWEGRQGSLTKPVKGDATGGSQGYAQLCCFLGDHQTVAPTAAAANAMAELLAWLAGRYAIDLRPGATATFVSRGSSLHPAGKVVTTSTIAAHREMSATTCPGDAGYRLVKGEIAERAAALAGCTAPTGVPLAEVFAFGDAPNLGSTAGLPLNQVVVGMAAVPSGGGYWLVAADGGIFPFGSAPGYGSLGGVRLNQAVVGMAAVPSGGGYWLVAADGGIFPFGSAPGYGSLGGVRLLHPVVGMAATHTGLGYWLVAADGDVFPFGDAGDLGRPDPTVLRSGRVLGVTPSPAGGGYWVVATR